MKTVEEVISSQPVFLNNWSSQESVVGDFAGYDTEPSDELKSHRILFASYGTGGYEGAAWVLSEKNGELFESTGSHCSCYGLEGQFSPEHVVLKELKNRLAEGTFGTDSYCDNNFSTELKLFLGI